MSTDPIDESQRKAAKVVGFTYLLALVPAIFAEFYVRGSLVVFDNAAQTAQNIVAHETLFRLGIAGNIAVFAVDVALITALYVVLKPVNRNLALVAAGWGLIETGVLVAVTLNDFAVLRILSGAGYMSVFGAERLQGLARLSIAQHDATYNVGLVFAGLRSTTFCYLWFTSGYIPKALSAWGVLASFLMGGYAFVFIIAPGISKIIPVEIYGGPIFLFELTMGLWLLMKGARLPDAGAQA
jgi:hypothetical protein